MPSAVSVSDEQSSVPSKQRIIGNRYVLHESIGTGGMGTVWRGHDQMLRRDAAVKEIRLPAGMAESERAMLCERTMREARAAASLNHPNVVKIFNVINYDDRPWIVMELLHARSLAEIAKSSGAMAVGEVARVGVKILSALQAAHRVGILHRDVKPGNVLLSTDGRITLTDFGVARSEGETSLTSTGLMLGSPQYIAPERARGQAFDAASDLWSLGATLFAAVEGQPPFDRGDPLSTMTAVVSEQPIPMAKAGPLAQVLDGLLIKDPQRRWTADQAMAVFKQLSATTVTVPQQAPRSPQTPTAAEVEADNTVASLGPGPECTLADLPQLPPESAINAAPSNANDETRKISARAQVMPVVPVAYSEPVSSYVPTSGPYSYSHLAYSQQPRVHARSRKRWLWITAWAVVAVLLSAFGAYVLGSLAVDKVTKAVSTPSSTPTPSRNVLPPGVTLAAYEGSDFSVSVPQGWEKRVYSGSRVRFYQDDMFIQIDSLAVSADDQQTVWEQGERWAQAGNGNIRNYQRVNFSPSQLGTHKSVQWEWTSTRNSTARHALENGAVINGRSYQIYLSVPEKVFSSYRTVLTEMSSTFRVTA